MDHDGTAGIAVTLGWIGDGGLPNDLAGSRVEGVQSGIGSRYEHLVLINRQTSRRAVSPCGFRTDEVFPNQIASAAIESLHRVAGVRQVDDSIVYDRSRLVGA